MQNASCVIYLLYYSGANKASVITSRYYWQRGEIPTRNRKVSLCYWWMTYWQALIFFDINKSSCLKSVYVNNQFSHYSAWFSKEIVKIIQLETLSVRTRQSIQYSTNQTNSFISFFHHIFQIFYASLPNNPSLDPLMAW